MKQLYREGVFCVIAVLLLATSCKKKEDDDPSPSTVGTGSSDNVPPTLILNGEAYVQLSRNASFDDPGAFATDNVDGTITDRIQVISNLDSSKFGLYNIIYTVSDKAGNYADPVVRNVEVVFGRDDFFGNYDVTADANCPATVQLNSPQEITAGTAPDEIVFKNVLPLIGGDLPAKVSGRFVTVIETTFQSFLTFSGNGEIDEEGEMLVMNLTVVNSLPFIGTTESCTFTYTKL